MHLQAWCVVESPRDLHVTGLAVNFAMYTFCEMEQQCSNLFSVYCSVKVFCFVFLLAFSILYF